MEIYKYSFSCVQVQTIYLPAGYQIVHVGLDPQRNFCIWAKVNASQGLVPLTLGIYYTGEPIPENAGKHLATVIGKRLVYHVFQLAN